jgi:hypothetical protein
LYFRLEDDDLDWGPIKIKISKKGQVRFEFKNMDKLPKKMEDLTGTGKDEATKWTDIAQAKKVL